jgi:hypothetical protein
MSDPASDRPESTHPTPRWVKRLWAIGALLVVLMIVLLVSGGHGPGRHQGAGLDRNPAHTTIGAAGGHQT